MCDIAYYFIGKFLIKAVTKISSFDNRLLIPYVLMFCVLGTFAINSSIFDVYVMFAFGLLGFVMKKFGFSTPAFVIAYVLGYPLETNLRQTLRLSDGHFWIFFKDPLCALLLVLSLFILCWFARKSRLGKQEGLKK